MYVCGSLEGMLSVVALVDDDGTRRREFQIDRKRITGDMNVLSTCFAPRSKFINYGSRNWAVIGVVGGELVETRPVQL